MSAMVDLALVGCGGISGAHVKGYRDLFERGCREFRVTACVDPNLANAEEKAAVIAEYQGTKPAVYGGIVQLLGAGLAEAADVCTPHCFHHSTAIPLLEGGLHVMVEKPIGLTIRATKQIIAAAEEAGRVLATGENIRRYLACRASTWAVKQRKLIGDIRMVVVQSVADQPFNYDDYKMKWRGIKLLTGGGMIMDSGAHFADMVQVLFGPVDSVYCTMQTEDRRMIHNAPVVGDHVADVEDAWHVVMRFVSGLHVVWTYSRSYVGPAVRSAQYYGAKGTMTDLGFPFHPFQTGANATLADGSAVSNEEIQAMYREATGEEQMAKLFPYGATDGFALEAWDFCNAIATGRKPEMDGTDGLRAKALCEACYESATLGEPVRYDDVLSGKISVYQDPIDAYWKIG